MSKRQKTVSYYAIYAGDKRHESRTQREAMALAKTVSEHCGTAVVRCGLYRVIDGVHVAYRSDEATIATYEHGRRARRAA